MECERADAKRSMGDLERQIADHKTAAAADDDDGGGGGDDDFGGSGGGGGGGGDGDGDGDGDDDNDGVKYKLVPKREFRQLIYLAHSADKAVEQIVLRILDEATEETGGEGEIFFKMMEQVWDSSLLKLQHHFARKIQRNWRNNRLGRLVAAVKKSTSDFEMRHDLDDEEVSARRAEREAAIVQGLREGASKAESLFEKISQDPSKRGASKLFYDARQLYSMESRALPSMETNDYLVLSQRLLRRLNILSKDANGGRRMWDKAKMRLKFITASRPRSDSILKKRIQLAHLDQDFATDPSSTTLSR
eukprot:747642-Hanusia_phi.AAC.3